MKSEGLRVALDSRGLTPLEFYKEDSHVFVKNEAVPPQEVLVCLIATARITQMKETG